MCVLIYSSFIYCISRSKVWTSSVSLKLCVCNGLRVINSHNIERRVNHYHVLIK